MLFNEEKIYTLKKGFEKLAKNLEGEYIEVINNFDVFTLETFKKVVALRDFVTRLRDISDKHFDQLLIYFVKFYNFLDGIESEKFYILEGDFYICCLSYYDDFFASCFVKELKEAKKRIETLEMK